jgi:NADH:ubiquinone oxidoreductase subunit 2 (subunit N)
MSSLATGLALGMGGLLLVVATFAALRPGRREASFGWAFVGGLAFVMLAMAAALRVESSGGLRAALWQLATVLLAGGAGMLSLTSRPESGPPSRLGATGRMVAWLALAGLPPTIGFHAKVFLYGALLGAGWGWAMALAMVASGALLVPALGELRAARAGAPRGAAAAAALLLTAAILLLGLAPYLTLAARAVGGEAG